MRTRKAVLAWADTRNGIAQHDSVSYAPAVIERLGYESGAYDIFIRTDSVVRGGENGRSVHSQTGLMFPIVRTMKRAIRTMKGLSPG